MSIILMQARTFATAAHGAIGQIRKWSGIPYITHPHAVVKIVESVPHDTQMLCAAWLHDVVEDTKIDSETIYNHFGDDIGDLVVDLTKQSKLSDGNRKIRKEIDLKHLEKASPRSKTIKLADIIHNLISMEGDSLRHPDLVQFLNQVWIPEKIDQLKVLTPGDKTLYTMLDNMLTKYKTNTIH